MKIIVMNKKISINIIEVENLDNIEKLNSFTLFSIEKLNSYILSSIEKLDLYMLSSIKKLNSYILSSIEKLDFSILFNILSLSISLFILVFSVIITIAVFILLMENLGSSSKDLASSKNKLEAKCRHQRGCLAPKQEDTAEKCKENRKECYKLIELHKDLTYGLVQAKIPAMNVGAGLKYVPKSDKTKLWDVPVIDLSGKVNKDWNDLKRKIRTYDHNCCEDSIETRKNMMEQWNLTNVAKRKSEECLLINEDKRKALEELTEMSKEYKYKTLTEEEIKATEEFVKKLFNEK